MERSPRKKRKRRGIWALTALALTLAVLLGLAWSLSKDPLRGKWRFDDVTAYQFDGNGEGRLLLPEKQYAFSYTVEGDTLSLDFADENARDFTYTWKVSWGRLWLTGGEGTETVTYTMTRKS